MLGKVLRAMLTVSTLLKKKTMVAILILILVTIITLAILQLNGDVHR